MPMIEKRRKTSKDRGKFTGAHGDCGEDEEGDWSEGTKSVAAEWCKWQRWSTSRAPIGG
jgi:hypothetical protein